MEATEDTRTPDTGYATGLLVRSWRLLASGVPEGAHPMLEKSCHELDGIAGEIKSADLKSKIDSIQRKLHECSPDDTDLLFAIQEDLARTVRKVESESLKPSSTTTDRWLARATCGLLLALLLGYGLTGARVGSVNAHVFWQPPDGGIDGTNSATVSLIADGEWHDYDLDIPLRDIVRLRIDPAPTGDIVEEVAIRDVTYSEVDARSARNGIPLPPVAWNPVNTAIRADGDILVVYELGTDPYILTHRFNPAAADHVSFAARVNSRRLSLWRWLWRDPG